MNVDMPLQIRIAQKFYPDGRVSSPYGDDPAHHLFMRKQDMIAFVRHGQDTGAIQNLRTNVGKSVFGETVNALFDLVETGGTTAPTVMIYIPAIECGWLWHKATFDQVVAEYQEDVKRRQ